MTVEGPKQPKIVTYMGALYDKMRSEANEVGDDDEVTGLIWQGKLIETCTSIGIPLGYYKKVVDTLRKIGSIELLTRGRRGNTPTTIALRFPPTIELYEGAIVKSGWDDLTRAPSSDTLGAEVRDLQQRLGGIDWIEVFKNFETRLQRLETALKVSQQDPQQQQQEQQQ